MSIEVIEKTTGNHRTLMLRDGLERIRRLGGEVICLSEGGLSGRAPVFIASGFLVALGAQYLGTTNRAVWVAGLALQTALAVFLLLKHRAER